MIGMLFFLNEGVHDKEKIKSDNPHMEAHAEHPIKLGSSSV